MGKFTAFMMTALTAAPLMGQTLQEQADSLSLTPIKFGDSTLALPTLPDAKVELLGADYKNIIRADGAITPVLEDTPVHVSFRVTKGDESVVSKDYVVTVPGVCGTPVPNANPKPQIIPELLSWKGLVGKLKVENTVVLSCAPTEIPVAETLANAMRRMGFKVTVGTAVPQAPCTVVKLVAKGEADGNTPEAYTLDINNEGVTIQGDANGLLHGGTTLMQMLAQDKTALPCGTAVDAPRFRLRGFMLDCGRLPIPMSYLKDVVRLMAWYKMNDLHIHLNDNFIFHETYVDGGKDPFKESYSAFRMESDVKGADGTPLTAQDLSYSKKEFREFIDFAKAHGVNVVPEFDTPGHALSFTRVRPDLIYQGKMNRDPKRRCEMLDASNPETLKFVGSVFDEYLLGDAPVFGGCTVHVGADEFFGEKEDYRAYMDGILKHVMSRGYHPRVWGSLGVKKGTTPVIAKGMQMNLWNDTWSCAWDSVKQGYDVINTNDASLYIVPFAPYYRMDKEHNWVYDEFLPNVVYKETLPAGHPQLLGTTFAVWNDMIDLRHNGYGAEDIWDIIESSMDVVSQKAWGKEKPSLTFKQHRELVAKLGTVPGAADHHHKPYTISMAVQIPAAAGKEIPLFICNHGTFFAAMQDGTVGFRRTDGMTFSFGVSLPAGETVKLELSGKPGKTTLRVNGGEPVEAIITSNRDETRECISTFPATEGIQEANNGCIKDINYQL